jgi:flagellar biosynthetic protein FlhB
MPEDRLILSINLQLFAADKTEQPTPKRKQDARKKGQIAKSNEVNTAFFILIGFYVLQYTTSWTAKEMMKYTGVVFTPDYSKIDFTIPFITQFFASVSLSFIKMIFPVLGVALLLGVGCQMMQVGFYSSAELLKPKWQRINPLEGIKRLISKRALVELVKSLLKISLILLVAYKILSGNIQRLPGLALLTPIESIKVTGIIIRQIGQWLGFILLAIAAFDYWYQWREYKKSIMMTKQELKEELRQTEGDPQLRAQIRRRQREMANRRMMQEVPTADVVITNPTHLAVALKYEPSKMAAPQVCAKGAGRVAERIKQIAGEHRVPVVENVWLAQALFKAVEIGQYIPEELFKAVAEILAFVYRLKGKKTF